MIIHHHRIAPDKLGMESWSASQIPTPHPGQERRVSSLKASQIIVRMTLRSAIIIRKWKARHGRPDSGDVLC